MPRSYALGALTLWRPRVGSRSNLAAWPPTLVLLDRKIGLPALWPLLLCVHAADACVAGSVNSRGRKDADERDFRLALKKSETESTAS
jgi:hypothetical protein